MGVKINRPDRGFYWTNSLENLVHEILRYKHYIYIYIILKALYFCNILNIHSPPFVDFCPSTCSINSASGDLSGYKGDLEIISVAQFAYNLILSCGTELKFESKLI